MCEVCAATPSQFTHESGAAGATRARLRPPPPVDGRSGVAARRGTGDGVTADRLLFDRGACTDTIAAGSSGAGAGSGAVRRCCRKRKAFAAAASRSAVASRAASRTFSSSSLVRLFLRFPDDMPTLRDSSVKNKGTTNRTSTHVQHELQDLL